MKPLERNSGPHEAQEAHTQKECQINENPHNHPDTDCGHSVNSGPGAGMPKYDGKNGVVEAGTSSAPTINTDQDEGNGPGMK